MANHRRKKQKKGIFKKVIIALIILALILGGAFAAWRFFETKSIIDADSNLYFSNLNANQQIGKTQMDIEYNFNCSHAIEYPIIGSGEIDTQITDAVNKLKEDFITEYKDENVVAEAEQALEGITYFQYIGYETYLAPDNKMSLVLFETQEAGDSNVISEKAYTYNFDLSTGKKIESLDVFVDGYKDKLSGAVKKYLTENNDYKDSLMDGYEDVISNKDENLNNYILTNDNLILYFAKYDILPGNFGIAKVQLSYSDIKDILKVNTDKTTVQPQANTGVNDITTVKFTDVNETVYATTTVHVREGYSTDSKVVATLNVGDSVTRAGVGDNGWSKVNYNNAEAYIYSSYLSTTKPEVKQENEIVNIQVNTSRNIDPSKPMVALTFDDGPNPNSTPKILETLKKYNAVATFFDLGTCMASYPKIAQEEEAAGCEVGSHTYGHKNLNTLSASQISDDIGKAESIFESTLGHKPYLIRTPYGNANSTVKSTLHYPLINWDIDTEDWKSRDADSVIGEVRKYSNYDGRVILMHSIYTSTAKAVETIVPELINKGYQLVTISELAKYKGVTLETGKLYYDFR